MSINDSKRGLTWLITGCSSGFGLSLTRQIISAGTHHIIATSRDPSRTPELVSEVEKAGGKWLALDVAEPMASENLVTELESEGIQIDILVNNAGYNVFAPAETQTPDEIRGQMETLFFGPLRLMKAMLPYMRQRRSGTIINLSSGASLAGAPSMSVYAAAKAGLDGYTRVFQREVAPFNIRTLTVILGTFNTNFGNGGLRGSAPVPDDYKGTTTDNVMQAIFCGSLLPNGDKDKAMKALYEVAVGEGNGAGLEDEPLILMGHDMIARAEGARDLYQNALDVSGDIARSAKLDS